MSDMTDYLENRIGDHILNGVASATIADVFFGLWDVTPTDVASSGTEVSGDAYARVKVTAGFTRQDLASRFDNDSAITWPQATPGAWGALVAMSIDDSVSGANMFMYKSISVTINAEDQLEILANKLGVTFA